MKKALLTAFTSLLVCACDQGTTAASRRGQSAGSQTNTVDGGSSETNDQDTTSPKDDGAETGVIKTFRGVKIEDSRNYFGNGPFDTLKGSGTFSYVQDLPGGARSRHHVAVSFSLEPGGVLDLKAFGDHSDPYYFPSKQHISLYFERQDAILKLQVTQLKADNTVGVLGYIDLPAEIDASQPLTLLIDIHNDGARPQILIWRKTETVFSAATALFDMNTLNLNGEPAPSAGWGFSLTKATLQDARLGTAKVTQ